MKVIGPKKLFLPNGVAFMKSRVLNRAYRVRLASAPMETLERRSHLSVTPSVVEVPISAAALAADPALADYRCFDLRLTITPGDKWAGCDMRANLTSGDFYNVPYPINAPIPALWPAYPHFEFDTFVSGYNFESPA